MCKVIAVTNQKGGVDKTTTTENLGIGLANLGKKVLLIDSDPQGSLTINLGHHEPDELDATLLFLCIHIVYLKNMINQIHSKISIRDMVNKYKWL